MQTETNLVLTGAAVTWGSVGSASTEPGAPISASGAQEKPSRECGGDGPRWGWGGSWEEDWLADSNFSTRNIRRYQRSKCSPMLGVSALNQASFFPFSGNIMS